MDGRRFIASFRVLPIGSLGFPCVACSRACFDFAQAGDLPGALAAYDSVLRMPSCPPLERVAALANRASTCMAGGDFGGAIDDSTAGIRELLSAAAAAAAAVEHKEPATAEAWVALAPAAGCAERSALSRLLARRGAARGHLRLFEEGAGDLEAAAALLRDEGAEERAESLEGDAARLRALAAEEQQGGGGGGEEAAGHGGGEEGAPPPAPGPAGDETGGDGPGAGGRAPGGSSGASGEQQQTRGGGSAAGGSSSASNSAPTAAASQLQQLNLDEAAGAAAFRGEDAGRRRAASAAAEMAKEAPPLSPQRGSAAVAVM